MANPGVKRLANGEPKIPQDKIDIIPIDDSSDDESLPTLADFLPKTPSAQNAQSQPTLDLKKPTSVSASSFASRNDHIFLPDARRSPASDTPEFRSAKSSPVQLPHDKADSNNLSGNKAIATHKIKSSSGLPHPQASNVTSEPPVDYQRRSASTKADESKTSTILASTSTPANHPKPSSSITREKTASDPLSGSSIGKARLEPVIDLTQEFVPRTASSSKPRRAFDLLDESLKYQGISKGPRPKPLIITVDDDDFDDDDDDDDDDDEVVLAHRGQTKHFPSLKKFLNPGNVSQPDQSYRKISPPRSLAPVIDGLRRRDRTNPQGNVSIHSQQPVLSNQDDVRIVVRPSFSMSRPWLVKGKDEDEDYQQFLLSKSEYHGKTEIYSTESDEIRMRTLAQPKAREIHRSEIKLDWGLPLDLKMASKTKPPYPRQIMSKVEESRLQDLQGPPITFVNAINKKRLPGQFQLVSKNIVHTDIKFAPKDAMFGCSCIDDCNPKTCECLLDDDQIDNLYNMSSSSNPGKSVPYIRLPSGLTVLTPEYIDRIAGHQIQECNEFCGCSPTRCWNRVVQKGRTLPIEIFMTPHCGFGLRCPLPIAKGQFIDTYVGELMTNRILVRREKLRKTAYQTDPFRDKPKPPPPSYIFSLDYFKDDEIKSVSQIYHIDGLRFGGPTRFINHSCDPNCRIFTVMTNNADFRVYNLAFFAIKDIPPGQELCFDYNPDEVGVETEEQVRNVVSKGGSRCYCGTERCKKVLWGGSKGN
ncbi:putative histone-lysine nsuv9 [Phaeomoniella chlamydospora]|uniref:Putative histone-lysine nsuv9 n=1 Tax=Phaeomoniella chlamydospora TaxID=158046 RepID=A0A0G2EWV3_PHACM|nr:putative histone-lysine nsuv9 [Phaeomoniella chlamydospora]